MTLTDLSQKPYLSLQEFAKHIGLHENTIRRLIKRGGLPQAVKFGNVYRIPPDAIPIDTPATKRPNPDEETTQIRLDTERVEADIRLLKAKKEKAELEGILLKGEQLAKREAELQEQADEVAGGMTLLDDRERQLNEQAEQMATERQQLPASATEETTKQLEDKEQALERKTERLNEQQTANKAEKERLDAAQKALDTRESSLKQRETELARNKLNLTADLNFLISTVDILRRGNNKEKKEATKEFESHRWLTMKVNE